MFNLFKKAPPVQETKPEKITEFRDRYYCFSNFGPGKVTVFGYTFDNGEAAFHSQKNPLRAHEFVGLDPSAAKKLGRRVTLRRDWESIKDNVMKEVVTAKFTQNKDLQRILLETGDKVLEEGNTWGDTYWGKVDGRGINQLGKILMEVRASLRS